MSVPSQAAVEENASVDVEILGVVPCAAGGAGEIVDLSGREHFLITGTMTATTFSGHFMIQPQGMSGIGETTGATYQAVGKTELSGTGSFVNGRSTMVFVNDFSIIGAGPGNNAILVQTSHVTFNADGTMTASVDNVHFECK